MRTSILILIVSSFLFNNQSLAACSLNTITDKLSQFTLNASFVQYKEIPALPQPLKSSGVIWMSEQSELVWQVNKPIKSTMLISQGELTQFNRKDKRLDSSKMTAPSGLATLLFSIANGDIDKMSEQFNLKLTCRESAWEILLVPKDEQLSQFLKELKLIGSTQLHAFSYLEQRGDKTRVELTHLDASLSVELQRYLN